MLVGDLLLFSRDDISSLQLVFGAFSKFYAASGLESNLDKRNLYCVGVTQEDLGSL